MLRALAKKVDVLRIALWASLRHSLDRPAIMTLQPVAALVIGHRYAAIRAVHGSAATAAQHEPGIAAAIDQHQRLRAERQAFGDPAVQSARNGAGLVRLLEIP